MEGGGGGRMMNMHKIWNEKSWQYIMTVTLTQPQTISIDNTHINWVNIEMHTVHAPLHSPHPHDIFIYQTSFSDQRETHLNRYRFSLVFVSALAESDFFSSQTIPLYLNCQRLQRKKFGLHLLLKYKWSKSKYFIVRHSAVAIAIVAARTQYQFPKHQLENSFTHSLSLTQCASSSTVEALT